MTDTTQTQPRPPDGLEAYVRNIAGRISDLERSAQARADAIVADAEHQAQQILHQARAEGRRLVEEMRRSLDEAVRLRDEELLAAVNDSHARVLSLVGEQLRANG